MTKIDCKNKVKTISKSTVSIMTIATMVMLLASMNTNVFADQSFGNWSQENYKLFLQRQHAAQPNTIVGTFTTTSNPCSHVAAAPPNNCDGYNTDSVWAGQFFYATPYSFLNDLPPGSCQEACANTDIQLTAPSQVEEAGKVWTWSSATSVQCAPNFGICTNPITWTDTPGHVYSIFSAPTGTPIQQTTTYLYTAGSDQIQIQFTNYIPNGYQ